MKLKHELVKKWLIRFYKDINLTVENFIRTNKLICYGGTAINNILPVEDQFIIKM